MNVQVEILECNTRERRHAPIYTYPILSELTPGIFCFLPTTMNRNPVQVQPVNMGEPVPWSTCEVKRHDDIRMQNLDTARCPICQIKSPKNRFDQGTHDQISIMDDTFVRLHTDDVPLSTICQHLAEHWHDNIYMPNRNFLNSKMSTAAKLRTQWKEQQNINIQPLTAEAIEGHYTGCVYIKPIEVTSMLRQHRDLRKYVYKHIVDATGNLDPSQTKLYLAISHQEYKIASGSVTR